MNSHQESFILYSDSIEEVMLLSMEQRGILLTTVFCYVNGNEIPELDLATSIIWSVWKKNIDRNKAKWEETRQRRSEAGKKGRLAAKTSNAKQSSTNQAVTVTGTATATATETVTVTETETVPVSVVKLTTPPNTLSLPLQNSTEYVISSEKIMYWHKLYPNISLESCFSDMKNWLIANPQKQREESKMDAFITNWLNNEQNGYIRRSNYAQAEQSSEVTPVLGTVL